MAVGDGVLPMRESGGYSPFVPGTQGQRLVPHGVNALLTWVTPASLQASPGAPTGTSNTGGKMMGLAGSITPTCTGKLAFQLSGSMANDTATNGAKVQLRYGTGAAPANGDALTGTTAGGLVEATLLLTAQKVPFALQATVSGLTIGTAYWLDCSLAAITAGTATITNLSQSAVEV